MDHHHYGATTATTTTGSTGRPSSSSSARPKQMQQQQSALGRTLDEHDDNNGTLLLHENNHHHHQYHHQQHPIMADATTTTTTSNMEQPASNCFPMLAHSDYTVPTSNITRNDAARNNISSTSNNTSAMTTPPADLNGALSSLSNTMRSSGTTTSSSTMDNNNYANSCEEEREDNNNGKKKNNQQQNRHNSRRSIFNRSIQKKYKIVVQQDHPHPPANAAAAAAALWQQPQPQPNNPLFFFAGADTTIPMYEPTIGGVLAPVVNNVVVHNNPDNNNNNTAFSSWNYQQQHHPNDHDNNTPKNGLYHHHYHQYDDVIGASANARTTAAAASAAAGGYGDNHDPITTTTPESWRSIIHHSAMIHENQKATATDPEQQQKAQQPLPPLTVIGIVDNTTTAQEAQSSAVTAGESTSPRQQHPSPPVEQQPLSPLQSPASYQRPIIRTITADQTTATADHRTSNNPYQSLQQEDDVDDDDAEDDPRMITPSSKRRNKHHRHIHSSSSSPHNRHHHRPATAHAVHETRHAQSLLLGLAFAAIWSPSNLMAPNLTQMASDLGIYDEHARDLYLGSYCALAVSVFSIPVAGAIGLWTDVVPSRKYLFVATAFGGAMAAFLTAFCTSYWQLFVCRWINGGFMAGSVPVIFSFLGDLFDVTERNAASSGLTAMMGMGIIVGQVYAGTVGSEGWGHAFIVSGSVTFALGILCMWLVKDPVRGGTEKVLQDMLQAGTRYERKLTWDAFHQMVRNNRSNVILLWQGFFSSLPWGVIFVFLNDYLSQERGFSVPDATYLVAVFGVGCAAGGILGGWLGQRILHVERSYLPLFMAVSTVLGILPFMGLLNSHFTNAHGFMGWFNASMGGLIASLPSVNVRPCLINVNPPESRGASLTTANLFINLGRGVGPCCITLIQSVFQTDRRVAFNVTMIGFWIISGLQLLLLMKTLPKDQDAMEAELASYAAQAIDMAAQQQKQLGDSRDHDENGSLISIEERITSFDGRAAQETFSYVRAGIRELRGPFVCGSLDEIASGGESSPNSEMDGDGDEMPLNSIANRRQQQFQQQARLENTKWTDDTLLTVPGGGTGPPTETTPLFGS